jgi:serine protease Do
MLRGFRSFILTGVLALLCGVLSVANADTSPTDNASIDIQKELKEVDQLISVERLEEALAALKAIEPDTTNTSAKIDVLLGKIYQRLHRPGKASELFERASFTSMEDGEAYLGLAETNLALGKLTLARRYSKATILSDPDLVGAHLVLARVDDRMSQTAKAKERFLNLIQNQPNSEPVILAYAQFLSQREDTDVAIKVLSKFTTRHPYAAEASDLLGQLYWQQGSRVDAYQTRTNAAKAFLAKGNKFRAGVI